MLIGLLVALMTGGSPPRLDSADDRCTQCGAKVASIRRSIAELHATAWRDRDRAAVALGEIRWECHPEVVAALAEALGRDNKAKVRAEAAESLGRMVPNLPSSHTALELATQDDPASSVRKQASQALAAKGRRCVADCPICGPLPTASAIIGPVLTLPEWADRPGPPRPENGLPLPLPR